MTGSMSAPALGLERFPISVSLTDPEHIPLCFSNLAEKWEKTGVPIY